MSATVTTLDDKIPPYIQQDLPAGPLQRPYRHRRHRHRQGLQLAAQLDAATVSRSSSDQPKDQLCVWVYGLFSDKPGDYVKKPMRDCTGREICMEWLYHIGVPEDQIAELAEHSANTVPVHDALYRPPSSCPVLWATVPMLCPRVL